MEINNSSTGTSNPSYYRTENEISLNCPVETRQGSTSEQSEQQGGGWSITELETVAEDSDWNTSISVFDVAYYVLSWLSDPCTTMKLHKLLYYCQAWHLVWEDKPLFKENIEAWANGPVIRELFNYHKGMYMISVNRMIGNPTKLSETQREDIETVLSFYGNKTSQWLIDQTHLEDPWKIARKDLNPNERGCSVISLESMLEYYSTLS